MQHSPNLVSADVKCSYLVTEWGELGDRVLECKVLSSTLSIGKKTLTQCYLGRSFNGNKTITEVKWWETISLINTASSNKTNKTSSSRNPFYVALMLWWWNTMTESNLGRGEFIWAWAPEGWEPVPRTRRNGDHSTKLRCHMSTVRTKQKSNLELGQVYILSVSTLGDIFSLARTYVLNFAWRSNI